MKPEPSQEWLQCHHFNSRQLEVPEKIQRLSVPEKWWFHQNGYSHKKALLLLFLIIAKLCQFPLWIHYQIFNNGIHYQRLPTKCQHRQEVESINSKSGSQAGPLLQHWASLIPENRPTTSLNWTTMITFRIQIKGLFDCRTRRWGVEGAVERRGHEIGHFRYIKNFWEAIRAHPWIPWQIWEK